MPNQNYGPYPQPPFDRDLYAASGSGYDSGREPAYGYDPFNTNGANTYGPTGVSDHQYGTWDSAYPPRTSTPPAPPAPGYGIPSGPPAYSNSAETGYGYWPGTQPQIPEQFTQMQAGGDRLRLRDRISRKVAAGTLATLALVGVGGVSAYEYLSSDKVSAAPASPLGEGDQAEKYTPTRNIDPTAVEVPSRVHADFARAAAVDQCEIKVTPDQATAMYQKLFGTQERTDLNDDELGVRVRQVTEQTNAVKAEQGLVPLPANFAELKADATADGPRAIPVAEYQRTVTDYFAAFGVKAVFDWSPDTPRTSPDFTDAMVLNGMGTPDTNPDTSIMRERVVQSMDEFSRLSPDIVQHTGPHGERAGRVIAFGNITDKRDAGLTSSTTGVIMIDTEKLGPTGKPNQTDQVIAGHELAHADQLPLCGLMVKRAASGYGLETTDPAIVALNGDAPYGSDIQQELQAGQMAGVDYTTLDGARRNPGAKVAYARPYGAENEAEDIGTLLGEHVFNAQGMVDIMTEGGDKTIMREKVALMLARLNMAEPKAAQYYVQLFSVARLSAAVQKMQEPLNEQIADAVERSFETGGQQPDNSPGTPYHEAVEKNRRYSEINQQLVAVVG